MNYKRKEIVTFITILLITDFAVIIGLITAKYAFVEEDSLKYLLFKLYNGMNIHEIYFEKLIISNFPYAILAILSAMIMCEHNKIDRLPLFIRYRSRIKLMISRLRFFLGLSTLFVMFHISIAVFSISPNYFSQVVSLNINLIIILSIQIIVYIYEYVIICGIANFLYGEIVAVCVWIIMYFVEIMYAYSHLGEQNAISLVAQNINILSEEYINYYVLCFHLIFSVIISIILINIVRVADIGVDGRKNDKYTKSKRY